MKRLNDLPKSAEGGEAPNDSPPDRRWSDAALVEGMRRNEPGSFREFFERFQPLVAALARVAPIAEAEREERIVEFLDDAALRLSVVSATVPRSIAAYLAASFRRRTLNGARDRRCRERLRHAYAADAGASSERVVASASSESAIRASHGPGWEPGALAPAIERLALELERGLTVEERQMLAWLAQRVPQREIASWLGITHGALRARVTRLRARLSDAAVRYAFRIDGSDRAELDRFFKRIDISTGRATASSPLEVMDGGRITEEEQER